MVLDAVPSPHTRRNYAKALDDLFPVFHLRLEQGLEIVQMRVVALSSLFGERCELRTDGSQPQSLAVLSDAAGAVR
jgi:hypothetical protein